MSAAAAAHIALALVLSPLLIGVINRTKAFFAGRNGQPLLQPYYDLARLLRKGAVYSRTTTWVFRAGPITGLAAVLVAVAVLPFGSGSPALAFAGDFLLFAALLGLVRFFLVVAALDTGSAFEGMGASREVVMSVIAEPALLLVLAALAKQWGVLSLDGMISGAGSGNWLGASPVLVLVAIAMFALLLAENARIPVDDPNTHLELTMIHEVMVLDHSGPDLAYILYTSALKMWLLGALTLGVVLPLAGVSVWAGVGFMAAGMVVLAVLIGVVESVMARLRMSMLPVFLGGTVALSVLALIIAFRG
ncbi:MAG: NADH-quinone oxidoreductase subunit H [Chloroflexi bacterium]|nr:NADH-quinone oxidoreductase subunit H [Chloroflexota bacterium]